MRAPAEQEVEVEIHPGERVTLRYYGDDPEAWIWSARANHESVCPECYEAACIERLKTATAPTHIDEVVDSGPAPAHWMPRMPTPLVRLVPDDEGELARAKSAEVVSRAAFRGLCGVLIERLRQAAPTTRLTLSERAAAAAPPPPGNDPA